MSDELKQRTFEGMVEDAKQQVWIILILSILISIILILSILISIVLI